ncbi:hypothetical protein [Streptomyces albipurpureus]|uniref:Uncharacterized protein n=1 Tax=Streptomyces albipurpureus TaxID=2897419 RepID=A0ABT0UT96_9ACTN|nr:hypothetical protein [Streptomyces sp. CWNU-1]MCM2391592.1 hypothetical protein [Streptomyces sp. CWNU-1]
MSSPGELSRTTRTGPCGWREPEGAGSFRRWQAVRAAPDLGLLGRRLGDRVGAECLEFRERRIEAVVPVPVLVGDGVVRPRT